MIILLWYIKVYYYMAMIQIYLVNNKSIVNRIYEAF